MQLRWRIAISFRCIQLVAMKTEQENASQMLLNKWP